MTRDQAHPDAQEDHGEPVTLDGGDRRCVQLLIELRRFIDGLAPGTLIHVVAADPAAPLDLPAWCHLTGHHYLGSVPDRQRPTYALHVRAGARTVDSHVPWRPSDP